MRSRDPHFKVMHNGEDLSRVTRSSDGQMLFLANMASKMNGTSPLGSRIAEVHKPGKAKADPLRGLFEATLDGKSAIIEYEPDLRDSEQVPILEEGGIEAFIRREVLPYTPDAWIKADATRIGYEVSFTRHLYKLKSLRTLEEIDFDILAIEKEVEELLGGSPGALMPTANVKAGDVIAMYGNTRSREQRLDH